MTESGQPNTMRHYGFRQPDESRVIIIIIIIIIIIFSNCLSQNWAFCVGTNKTRYSRYKLKSTGLTHICLVDFSILINWTSPFPILAVFGVRFHFHSILNRYSCQQTVKTLIRRRVLRRLIWVCTVCLCPKNGTLGLYGLKYLWLV